MRVSKQLPVLLNWYGNILLLQQILTADMNNFDGCFPPNRFPNRKEKLINGEPLSKLFLAIWNTDRFGFSLGDNPKLQ